MKGNLGDVSALSILLNYVTITNNTLAFLNNSKKKFCELWKLVHKFEMSDITTGNLIKFQNCFDSIKHEHNVNLFEFSG